MRPLAFKALSPLVLLAALLSGCGSSAPSLMRLDCSADTIQRQLVFDRQTGQLYYYASERDAYVPQPDNRFTVKTKGRIKANRLVVETRVGEWSQQGMKRVLTPITPAVGSDLTVDLTTLKSEDLSLGGKGLRSSKTATDGIPTPGQCKRLSLATHWVEVHHRLRAREVR